MSVLHRTVIGVSTDYTRQSWSAMFGTHMSITWRNGSEGREWAFACRV